MIRSQSSGRRVAPAVFLLITLACFSAFPVAAAPQGPAIAPGVLSYVRSNDATGDEIWYTRSDGSEDHRVFSTGRPDPGHIFDIGSLAWKKDGAELAFDSNHEFDCSFYDRDIYSIRANGAGYRRITQAPACRDLAAFPQGSVTVPVENSSTSSVVAFVYFQGAPAAKQVSLPPLGSTSVTFEQVADLIGPDYQVAVAIQGLERQSNLSSADVIPGGHVVAEPPLRVGGPGDPAYGPVFPSWHYSGDRLAYSLLETLLYRITANPTPLQRGDFLLNENADTLLFENAPEYGPTPSLANQFLYLGWDVTDAPAIYLATEGGIDPGQRLVSTDGYDHFTGLAWIPDGSGFVYSRHERDTGFMPTRANVYEYSFATGQSKRVSNLPDGSFAHDLSVSADGQVIAFEVSGTANSGPYDLWMMDRNGANARLFRAGASSPAWSPGEVANTRSLYLPLILR